MAIFRVSIGRVMGWVAVVGGNLGVWRTLARVSLDAALLIVPILVALQVGGYLALRSRGGGLWFWLGFVALGASGPMMICWFALLHQTAGAHSWAVQSLEGSIDGLLRWQRPLLRSYQGDPLVMGASFAVTAFLPQCLVALAGGCSAHLILKPCWRLLRGRRAPEGPPEPAL